MVGNQRVGWRWVTCGAWTQCARKAMAEHVDASLEKMIRLFGA
jgi:hypothetical protein